MMLRSRKVPQRSLNHRVNHVSTRVDQLRAYLPLNASACRENSRDAVSGVQRRSSYTPGTTRSYAPTLRGGGRATALRREYFRGGCLQRRACAKGEWRCAPQQDTVSTLLAQLSGSGREGRKGAHHEGSIRGVLKRALVAFASKL
jgi:hypothetical protein